ncbi:MAG TPA: imidazole glycerol phosphate synthase subunit HisF [Candidatus Baltobacteraceae bacterium]|nr:imidazole glycerol phosphate synthase subunit HisF [Candidatus Baltobacteraceae bacterium]
MLAKRIIACLDIRDGRVVKGQRFANLREAGDPVERARRYRDDGVDEIVVLDVSATLESRLANLRTIESISTALDVPLTVGGGVRGIGDVARLLDAGADKVAINSAALEQPALLAQAASRFGSQCIVISIDAYRSGERYAIATHSATRPQARDAVTWAREAQEFGAGEVLLTSIDRDGGREGFDLDLVRAVRGNVNVPVVASGGASDAQSFADVLEAGADAALGASIFHDDDARPRDVKDVCRARGLEVRA